MPTTDEIIQTSKRRGEFFKAVSSLPQYEGWTPDEVIQNVSGVLRDPSKKTKFFSALSENLPQYAGWKPEEVEQNTSSFLALPKRPVAPAPQPVQSTPQPDTIKPTAVFGGTRSIPAEKIYLDSVGDYVSKDVGKGEVAQRAENLQQREASLRLGDPRFAYGSYLIGQINKGISEFPELGKIKDIDAELEKRKQTIDNTDKKQVDEFNALVNERNAIASDPRARAINEKLVEFGAIDRSGIYKEQAGLMAEMQQKKIEPIALTPRIPEIKQGKPSGYGPASDEEKAKAAVQVALGLGWKKPEDLHDITSAIGRGIAEGLTVEVPRMAGQFLQYLSPPEDKYPQLALGRGLINASEQWSKDLYGPEPDYGTIGTIAYEGSKMLAPSMIPGYTLGAYARLALRSATYLSEAQKAALALSFASRGTGLFFGLSQAQSVKDAAKAKGVDPGFAPEIEGLIEAIGETLGTKYLGKMLHLDEDEVKVTIGSFLKTLGVETGTEFFQQYSQAWTDKIYGIRPDANPWDEAIQVIGPTAFMTAMTGVAGSIASNVKKGKGDVAQEGKITGAEDLPKFDPRIPQVVFDQSFNSNIKTVEASDGKLYFGNNIQLPAGVVAIGEGWTVAGEYEEHTTDDDIQARNERAIQRMNEERERWRKEKEKKNAPKSNLTINNQPVEPTDRTQVMDELVALGVPPAQIANMTEAQQREEWRRLAVKGSKPQAGVMTPPSSTPTQSPKGADAPAAQSPASPQPTLEETFKRQAEEAGVEFNGINPQSKLPNFTLKQDGIESTFTLEGTETVADAKSRVLKKMEEGKVARAIAEKIHKGEALDAQEEKYRAANAETIDKLVNALKQVPPQTPQWVQQEIDNSYAQAVRLGIADKIEELAAQRLTLKEILAELRKTVKLPDGERLLEAHNIIAAVRSKRGIPSMDDKQEFEKWLANRNKPKTQQAKQGDIVEHSDGKYNLPDGTHRFRVETAKNKLRLVPIDAQGKDIQIKTKQGTIIDAIILTPKMVAEDFRVVGNKPKTQKDIVAGVVASGPKHIKEIAAETGILEPNIRRILGVGTKEGVFERVAEGVYTLVKGNETVAVLTGDAEQSLSDLADQGFKADMVFLDPPYTSGGAKGGNRPQKFPVIPPSKLGAILKQVARVVRNDNTPVIYVMSLGSSGKKEAQQYNAETFSVFKPIARGYYRKTDASGKPVQMLGREIPPETVILMTKSGEMPVLTIADADLQMTFVRPSTVGKEGYQTKKPLEMLEKLIGMTTLEGAMVLDPFAGSGTTGVAALKQRRSAVLIEIQPDVVKNLIIPRIEKAAAALPAAKPQDNNANAIIQLSQKGRTPEEIAKALNISVEEVKKVLATNLPHAVPKDSRELLQNVNKVLAGKTALEKARIVIERYKAGELSDEVLWHILSNQNSPFTPKQSRLLYNYLGKEAFKGYPLQDLKEKPDLESFKKELIQEFGGVPVEKALPDKPITEALPKGKKEAHIAEKEKKSPIGKVEAVDISSPEKLREAIMSGKNLSASGDLTKSGLSRDEIKKIFAERDLLQAVEKEKYRDGTTLKAFWDNAIDNEGYNKLERRGVKYKISNDKGDSMPIEGKAVEYARYKLDKIKAAKPKDLSKPKRKAPRSAFKPKFWDAESLGLLLLARIGKGGISPNWVLDRKTGKIKLAGEFIDINPYFLDLSNKPKLSDFGEGTIVYGSLDVDAANLGFESGDALLAQLEKEEESYYRMQGEIEYMKNLSEEEQRQLEEEAKKLDDPNINEFVEMANEHSEEHLEDVSNSVEDVERKEEAIGEEGTPEQVNEVLEQLNDIEKSAAFPEFKFVKGESREAQVQKRIDYLNDELKEILGVLQGDLFSDKKPENEKELLARQEEIAKELQHLNNNVMPEAKALDEKIARQNSGQGDALPAQEVQGQDKMFDADNKPIVKFPHPWIEKAWAAFLEDAKERPWHGEAGFAQWVRMQSGAFYLAGGGNASLRQDILEALTGKRPPKSKAGVTLVERTIGEWAEKNLPSTKPPDAGNMIPPQVPRDSQGKPQPPSTPEDKAGVDEARKIIEGDEKLDDVQSVAKQYGWKAEKTDTGYNLFNANSKHVATATILPNGYKIASVEGTKLLTGTQDISKAIEKVITQYFYGKKRDNNNLLAADPSGAGLVAYAIWKIGKKVMKAWTIAKGQVGRVMKGQPYIPLDDISVSPLQETLAYKPAKFMRSVTIHAGLPFYIGDRNPLFRAMWEALRGTFFEANERYHASKQVLLEIDRDLKPTKVEKNNVRRVLEEGDSREVQKYFSEEELRSRGLTDKERQIYNRLVEAQKIATEIRMDGMRFYLMQDELDDSEVTDLDIKAYEKLEKAIKKAAHGEELNKILSKAPQSVQLIHDIRERLSDNEWETLKKAIEALNKSPERVRFIIKQDGKLYNVYRTQIGKQDVLVSESPSESYDDAKKVRQKARATHNKVVIDDVDLREDFDNIKSLIQDLIVDDYVQREMSKLGGYFSRQRHGKYYVSWKDKDTGDYAYDQKELHSEMTDATEGLRRLGHKDIKSGTIDQMNLAVFKAEKLSLSELLELVEQLGIEDNPQVQRLVNEFKKLGFAAHSIQRRYTPGYNRTYNDFVRGIHDYAQGAARNLARTKGKILGSQALAQVNQAEQPIDYKLAADWMRAYYESPEEYGSLLRKGIYFGALTASPSFLLQQLFQPLTTHLSNIVLYAGKDTPRIIATSLGQAAWYVEQITARRLKGVSRITGSNELFDMLERTRARGSTTGLMIEDIISSTKIGGHLMAPHTTQALVKMGADKQTVQNTLSALEGAMQFLNAGSERWNRILGFVEGYHIGKKQGLSGEELFRFAENWTERVNVPYGKENLPLWIQKTEGIMRTGVRFAYMFLPFQFAITHMMGNTLRAQQPAARKAASFAAGTTAWIANAGLMGTPYAAILLAMYKLISGDDEPLEEVQNMQQSDNKWERAIGLLLDGGMPALMGYDMRRSLGAGDINPLDPSRLVPTRTSEMLSESYEEVRRKEFGRAAMKFPIGIPPLGRAYFRGKEAEEFGIPYGAGEVGPLSDYTEGEQRKYKAGLTPWQMGKKIEAKRADAEHRAKRSDTMDLLADRFARAVKRGDNKAREDVIADMREYNKKVKSVYQILPDELVDAAIRRLQGSSNESFMDTARRIQMERSVGARP